MVKMEAVVREWDHGYFMRSISLGERGPWGGVNANGTRAELGGRRRGWPRGCKAVSMLMWGSGEGEGEEGGLCKDEPSV